MQFPHRPGEGHIQKPHLLAPHLGGMDRGEGGVGRRLIGPLAALGTETEARAQYQAILDHQDPAAADTFSLLLRNERNKPKPDNEDGAIDEVPDGDALDSSNDDVEEGDQ